MAMERIWLSNVECTGTEYKLIHCNNTFNTMDGCTNAESPIVQCTAGILHIVYLVFDGETEN